MNLELKHLAPYLPYGLNLKINTPFGTTDRKFEIDCGHDFNLHLSECNIKPILRPLSDLTKEEINSFSVGVRLALKEDNNIKLLSRISFDELQWLIERHFDVFGLIENGLAIDINTLND